MRKKVKENQAPIQFSKLDGFILGSLQKGGTLGCRAAEVLEVLFLRDNFRPFVNELRSRLKIDPKRLADNEYRQKVFKKFYTEDFIARDTAWPAHLSVDSETKKLVRDFVRYEIVPIFGFSDLFMDDLICEVMIEYTLLNRIPLAGGRIGMLHRTEYGKNDPDNDMEEEIVFTFLAGITKKEALRFVDESWHFVKYFNAQILREAGKRRRTPHTNFARDVEVFNTYQTELAIPVEERKDKYVRITVANKLKGKGIIVDSDRVQSVYYKMRDLKSRANRPADKPEPPSEFLSKGSPLP